MVYSVTTHHPTTLAFASYYNTVSKPFNLLAIWEISGKPLNNGEHGSTLRVIQDDSSPDSCRGLALSLPSRSCPRPCHRRGFSKLLPRSNLYFRHLLDYSLPTAQDRTSGSVPTMRNLEKPHCHSRNRPSPCFFALHLFDLGFHRPMVLGIS